MRVLLAAVLLASCADDGAKSTADGSLPPPVIDAAPAVDVVPPPDATPGTQLPWSRLPPGGKTPAEVPQLVAVSFDDNFGEAQAGAVGGVSAIVEYFAGKK